MPVSFFASRVSWIELGSILLAFYGANRGGHKIEGQLFRITSEGASVPSNETHTHVFVAALVCTCRYVYVQRDRYKLAATPSL